MFLLPPDQSRMIKQTNLSYYSLGIAFQKQIKTIEDQAEKQIKAFEENGEQLTK